MKRIETGSAIIRRDDHILMVRQPGPDGLYWFIPGGVAEPKEEPDEAAIRETYEETGLTITDLRGLAFLTKVGWDIKSYAFEVAAYTGTLRPNDPDDLVESAAFVPLEEAVRRLADVPWAYMREPLMFYLQEGEAGRRMWVFDDPV